jgi:hypothetical protein
MTTVFLLWARASIGAKTLLHIALADRRRQAHHPPAQLARNFAQLGNVVNSLGGLAIPARLGAMRGDTH